jgi:hypothetical protein
MYTLVATTSSVCSRPRHRLPNMTPKDWIQLIGTLLSPLIAVQVSLLLQRRKEKKEERLKVFRALMSTRAAPLSGAHVDALNMIDVVFYDRGKKQKAVLEAHNMYLAHLGKSATETTGWLERRVELLIDLLQKMATALDYEFDKAALERTSYIPIAYGDVEADAHQLRKLTVALLKGERSLPMFVTGISQTPPNSVLPAETPKNEPPQTTEKS